MNRNILGITNHLVDQWMETLEQVYLLRFAEFDLEFLGLH